ncbi:hypothetical protein ACK3SF_04615 [Candidatus Nanosalina sp. VS9-1]|uniref:DUF7502 family protein n=1 Tax=Candidatus Nanosalina sp. VS9-1 TaxID=3388566 RepID=UPI0039E0B392
MKVEKLLRRLKIEFVKVNILQACLDSIMFFLGFNLVLYVFNLEITGPYSNFHILVGLTGAFFLGDLIYRVRKYNVELYEEKNPELDEILRTARDNIDRKNIASQALFDELVDRARNVTSESIIPSQEIIKKVMAIGILSFLTLASGLADFQIEGPSGEIVPSDFELPGTETGQNTSELDVRNGSNILGEPSDIDVEQRDLEFEISGNGKASDQQFSFSSGSEDFTVESSRQGLGEDRELAKQYSNALREIEASE